MRYNTINRTCSSCLWLILLCSLFSCVKKEYITQAAEGTVGAVGDPPQITGFTPDVSWYDHIVEINGKNFSKELAENTVRIGKQEVEIMEASTTKLKVRLVAGTQRGYIHVKTNGREVISDRELVINQLAWQKALGGTTADVATAIYPANGGGYIVVGYTGSTDGDITTGIKGATDMWFAKLDSAQHIVWQKSLGGLKEDKAVAAAPTADGGFLILGNSASIDGDFKGGIDAPGNTADIWVIKVDGNGTVVWKKMLGGSFEDRAAAIVANADGSCVMAGATASKDGDVKGFHGVYDMWVVKLDAGGNLVWQKALGSTGDDNAWAIARDADGGYLVAGSTNGKDGDVTNPKGGYDMWVVKLNTNGGLVWQRTLGGYDYDLGMAITASPDGGSAVAGFTKSIDGDVSKTYGNGDIWVVKLNATGGIRWQKTLGGSNWEMPNAIQATADGGYAIAGATNSNDGDVKGNHGGDDIWFVKLNADRTVAGQRTLGGTTGDELFGMSATADKGYLLAGWTSSTDGDVTDTHDKMDMWVLKVWE